MFRSGRGSKRRLTRTSRWTRPAHRHVPRPNLVLSALDTILIACAQAALFAANQGQSAVDIVQFALGAGLPVVLNFISLHAFGCYRGEVLTRSSVTMFRVLIALAAATAVLIPLQHMILGALYPSESLYTDLVQCLLLAISSAAASLAAIAASRALAYTTISQDWFRRRILVIGSGKRAQSLRELMQNASHRLGNDLFFVSESVLKSDTAWNANLTATEERSVGRMVSELQVDEIVVAADDCRGLCLESLLLCKVHGKQITDYSSFVERETGRVDLNQPELSWLVYSDGFRLTRTQAAMKRLLDILLSSALLVIAIPVLLGAMLAVRLEGTGPIFFRQQRVTLGGRTFWLYKLRTMRTDAEINGPQWSTTNDARITRVGNILRRHRLDEIPQLFNVLKGEMSLVGPRPEVPAFVEHLSRHIPLYDLRHNVKAGITGWAQINYKYGSSMADALRKLEYDLYYMKNFSLIREISIMVQTLRVLIWPPGAM